MSKNFGRITKGTPVNAVNATKTLTISGVVIDGETVTINNLARPLTVDKYEFLGDVALTKTLPSNIAVDLNAVMVKATGVLTVDTKPTAGDTMTIGTTVYTFIAVNGVLAAGKISVGADLAAAKVNIVAAINGTDGKNTKHPLVSASNFSSNDCTLTALIAGVVGNAIPTTETFTAETNVFAAVTLENGVDCSATDAVTALVAAITAHDTQGVGAVDSTGGVITLTADVAGADGNNISLAKVMAHGAFDGDATKLSGGVDGTLAHEADMMVDDSYFYVAVAKNIHSGKNWRRISVGSAY